MKKKNSLFFSFLYPFYVENLADSYFNNTTNKKPTRTEKEIKETLRKWKIAKYLTKIWISSFFFFLHSFSIEDQLTHILTMREIKIPKIEKGGSNRERSTTMKSCKTTWFEYIGHFSHFSSPCIPPVCEEGGKEGVRSHPGRLPREIPKWLKARHGTTTVCITESYFCDD